MFSKSIGGALCAGLLVLGACARQPEPVRAPIQPQPIYNKYGDVVGCEGGTYVPGSNYENPCEPPDEGCSDPSGAPTTAYFPCLPRNGGDGPDDRPRVPGQSPTGGPNNP